MLYALFALQIANVALLVRLVALHGFFTTDTFVGVLVVGINSGYSGIVVAHELIHRASTTMQQLGRFMLVSVLYEFVPYVLPIAVGTEVRFPNHDQIHHHVYSFSRVKSFDLPLSKGEEAAPVLFTTPGVVKVGCNNHDWMMGVILVVPTPFFATTDDGGAFVSRDAPAGDVTLTAWHEAPVTPPHRA